MVTEINRTISRQYDSYTIIPPTEITVSDNTYMGDHQLIGVIGNTVFVRDILERIYCYGDDISFCIDIIV
jgi:hypothetical protein